MRRDLINSDHDTLKNDVYQAYVAHGEMYAKHVRLYLRIGINLPVLLEHAKAVAGTIEELEEKIEEHSFSLRSPDAIKRMIERQGLQQDLCVKKFLHLLDIESNDVLSLLVQRCGIDTAFWKLSYLGSVKSKRSSKKWLDFTLRGIDVMTMNDWECWNRGHIYKLNLFRGM